MKHRVTEINYQSDLVGNTGEEEVLMKKIHLTWKLTWEARSVTKVRRAMYVCKG